MILSQNDPRWSGYKLGNSPYTLGQSGCFTTVLAEILNTTPDVINERLLAGGGFDKDENGYNDLVLWSKIKDIFPGVTATYYKPYSNDIVLAELARGNSIIATVTAKPIGGAGTHAVRYIGGQRLHDPWGGIERKTSDFGKPYSFVVIEGTWNDEPLHDYKIKPSIFTSMVTKSGEYDELWKSLGLPEDGKANAKSHELVLKKITILCNQAREEARTGSQPSAVPIDPSNANSSSDQANSIWQKSVTDALKDIVSFIKGGKK